jgi:DNA invertase Pin-like site-specific DNA recombinase
MASTPPRRRRPEVARGIAAARERGVKLGRPPAPVPDAGHRAAELREQGLSLAQIAATLDQEHVPTPSGKGGWSRSSVQYVLRRWDSEHQPG